GVLSLWISGPASDEDWIDVVAVCNAPSCTVSASGAIMQLSDLREWRSQLERMNRTLTGRAALISTEPNINLSLELDKLGNITGRLSITPDVLTQLHEIQFEIDQSYLPPVIAQIRSVIQRCE